MQTKSQRFMRVLPWLLLGLVAVYFIFGGGWQDAIRGRFHRKAHDLFSDVSGITEVKIYLLHGTREQETSERFRTIPVGDSTPVCGTVVLQGKQLEAFLDLWIYQLVSFNERGMCHDPPYGFRLYRGSRLVAETTVCWHCSNFTVGFLPMVSAEYGFDADSKAGQKLLNYCDALLPYARDKTEKAQDEK